MIRSSFQGLQPTVATATVGITERHNTMAVPASRSWSNLVKVMASRIKIKKKRRATPARHSLGPR